MRTGHLLQGPTPGEHLGRGRDRQDQLPGPDRGPRTCNYPGPVLGKVIGPVRTGGPDGRGAVQGRAGAGTYAGRVSDESGHADHHLSAAARGWGSPVSAASAAATSDKLART